MLVYQRVMLHYAGSPVWIDKVSSLAKGPNQEKSGVTSHHSWVEVQTSKKKNLWLFSWGFPEFLVLQARKHPQIPGFPQRNRWSARTSQWCGSFACPWHGLRPRRIPVSPIDEWKCSTRKMWFRNIHRLS